MVRIVCQIDNATFRNLFAKLEFETSEDARQFLIASGFTAEEQTAMTFEEVL